jgi:hypothetical protein
MARMGLYCKSYGRDFLRLKRLLASILEFNCDQLPVYISTASAERQLLEATLGTQGYTWISDEQIIASNPRVPADVQGRKSAYINQGIIKAEFWRLGLADNYLCIDADSKFLRNFYERDFIAADGEPYTVMHENKELWQMAVNRGQQRVLADFRKEVGAMQQIFQRQGPDYSFMPSPFLWSAKVWASLDKQFLEPRGQTLWDVVDRGLGEYHWYGEALLAYQAIPLRPVEPYFRVYHYDWQYFILRRQGETEAKVASNYTGIIYQSNWDYGMDMGVPEKSLLSRFLRRIKQQIRFIRTYF